MYTENIQERVVLKGGKEMRSGGGRKFDRIHNKEQRAFPVFRFRRGAQMRKESQTSPFTEMPEELKHSRVSFGRLARGFFSFLFLFVLGLALVALVLAFAYQMITDPEALGAWANDVITTVVSFIQSLLPAGQ